MDLDYKNNEMNHLINNILDEKFSEAFESLDGESRDIVRSYIFEDTDSFQTSLDKSSLKAIQDIQHMNIKDPYVRSKVDLAIANIKDNEDKITIIEVRNDLQT